MHDDPTSYSERRRLADSIGDARKALDEGPRPDCDGLGTSRYCGRLEALLTMVCDSGEAVAAPDAAKAAS